MTDSKTILQTIAASSDDPNAALALAEAVAAEARAWAEIHRTAVSHGKPGHIQPGMPQVTGANGYTLAVERERTDYFGGSFHVAATELLEAALECEESPVAILAHPDAQTELRSLYIGMVKHYDDDTVTFYDNVKVERDNMLGLAV